MKIESNNLGPENLAAKKLERSQTESAQNGGADGAAKGGDRVALSPDAALANAAVKAASESPDLRADLVERMKKAMATGELGKDAHGLAESLIDRMLDEK